MLGRRDFSRFVVALCFGSSLMAGQSDGTQSSLPFRSSARLVVLDVTVSDGSDHPVANLSAKDFTVLEDGIPQRIESFERPEAHTLAAHQTQGGDLWQARGETAPVTILVLDELNTAFQDTTFA